MWHDKMYVLCQADLRGIKGIFMEKTVVCSLSSCWMPGQPSLRFCCLSVQAQHNTIHATSKTDICKTGSFNVRLQNQQLRKVIFQISESPSGCCCVLCPSENQITSWAVASMRVAGTLSHFSVEVLPSRHRWKTWSFAVFTTGTLLSSLPNVPQQNRAMTHSLIFALLRHRRLFQRHSPIWRFFPKTQSNSHLLCSLCCPITGHSKSHFSQPWVHSDQYLPLP